MAPGRRSTPRHLKILKGNPGKRPISKKEPTPKKGIPKPPEWLTDAARDHWKEIAGHLDRMGVLTHADGTALALLVAALAEYIEARKVVDAEGPSYETVNEAGSVMHRKRPEVEIASDAWKRVRAMLTEFGITPASRTKVERTPTADAEKDPWAAVANG